ncbi:MAG: heme biosynthesis protein HemY [Phreatobacter sp.]
MVGVILFLLLLAALATGGAWIADQPGTVTVVWLGRHIEFEVLTGLIAVLIAAAVIMALIALVKWLIASPRIAARVMQRRKIEKGQEAITRGIVAIGAGDRRAAEKYAYDADRLIPDAPLTLLLKAQAAQLAGDRPGAEKAFRAMLDRPDTKVLGLRGLYVEAQRRTDVVAARAIAEEAAKASPSATWAAQAVLEQQGSAGDWDGALTSIERQYAARVIDKDTAKRQRAVLLTAKAAALEERDPAAAKALAIEAVGLAPDLVPAAAIVGRLAAADGDIKKASRVIEAAWKIAPHPDLAEAYAHARQGDSRGDQLKRVETLARLTPSHPEALLAIGRAAIDASDFAAAHRALDELAAGAPTQRLCLLMAELSAKESNDQGRAREWMARALRAPRDPAWTADGQASDVWLPASPVTGKLDAFQWKVPVAELGGPMLHVDDVLADASEAVVPAAPIVEIVEVEAKPQPDTRSEVETRPEPTVRPEPEAPQPITLPAAADPAPPADTPSASPAEAAPENGAKPRVVRGETVFPIARAPDDPGPDGTGEPKRRMSFFGS